MTSMPRSLEGKIALITGASRGLGLEIVRRFVQEGANVAIAARDASALESIASSLRSAFAGMAQRVASYPVDLSKSDEVDALAADVLRDFGGVDILVNNAAIQGPIGQFETNSWEDWRAVFDVNLFAPARLTQLLTPKMRARGGGKIINISGGGAVSPRPSFSAYGASKCALVRLTETLAMELKADRTDVNAVAPGAMNTQMTREVIDAGSEGAPAEYEAAVARARDGGASSERAVSLVAWLASSISDGITGKLISAVWDDWEHLADRQEELRTTDLFTMRRVT